MVRVLVLISLGGRKIHRFNQSATGVLTVNFYPIHHLKETVFRGYFSQPVEPNAGLKKKTIQFADNQFVIHQSQQPSPYPNDRPGTAVFYLTASGGSPFERQQNGNADQYHVLQALVQ